MKMKDYYKKNKKRIPPWLEDIKDWDEGNTNSDIENSNPFAATSTYSSIESTNPFTASTNPFIEKPNPFVKKTNPFNDPFTDITEELNKQLLVWDYEADELNRQLYREEIIEREIIESHPYFGEQGCLTTEQALEIVDELNKRIFSKRIKEGDTTI